MKLNKKQKRTATIASMAALLAVVLGMGGQTFAKYISTQETTAQATVARWGYVLTANFDNLFGSDYTGGSIKTNDTGAGVSAIADGKVVAPGTSGSTTVTVNGVGEVSTELSFTVSGTDVGLYTGDPSSTVATYAPVKWTVVTSGFADDADNGTKVDGKELKAVVSYFDDLYKEFAPETSLNLSFVISWEWVFSSSAENDKYDTYLGEIAQKRADNSYSISAEASAYAEHSVTALNFAFEVKLAQSNK